MSKQKTVFVGLSGGVDSSVAALRLKSQGYKVTGVFIKVWQPDFLNCNWEAERLDAMRVAAKLEIPFLTCDSEKEYEEQVAKYFISEYLAGRTPNPDVMCNKYVKFGSFLRFATDHGADFVATGHYAQNQSDGDKFKLLRGVDHNKDQSYFLWTLTQSQLSQILFPVGNSQKETIRQEAVKAGLITGNKKDSQGICFLGQVDIPEFLSHFTDLKPGKVLNENGEVIGTHKGALVYTTGQRHGFSITTSETSEKSHYVIDRNLETNTITVSTQPPILSNKSILKLDNCNFIDFVPSIGEIIQVQTRYRQKPSGAKIVSYDGGQLELQVTDKSESVSIGQSCVLYQGECCLGGGIIA